MIGSDRPTLSFQADPILSRIQSVDALSRQIEKPNHVTRREGKAPLSPAGARQPASGHEPH